jgi:flavin reductase (DIM6/NTAB) family NADH-FMN oxidoreductase RutF
MKKSLGAATLIYPTPVWIVGTYDGNGRPNVMTAAWGSVCCSKPPCVAVSLQKVRHSYEAIMQRRAFTISVPSQDQVKLADFFGMVSGKNVDKFAASGLTPVRSDLVDAPYPAEFPLVLECRVLHILEIGLHTQFVGEILDVKAEESIMDGEQPDIAKLRPIIYAPGARTYHALGEFLGKGYVIGREFQKTE